MPTYSFLDTKNGKTFDKFMSISAREEFLKNNPDLQPILTSAPAISGDSVSLGFRKTDGGFNDLMNRIGKANPGSAVSEKYVSRSAKDVAVDNVVKKHGLRKGGS